MTDPVNWDSVLKETEEATRVIPEGEYLVRVTEAKAKTASTGSEMIVTTVKLEDGPYAGRTIVTNLVFSFGNAQAMRMLLRRLRALGITEEWLAETNATIDQIATAISGRTVIAKVNQRKWNEELRNDIEMFVGSGSGIPFSGPAPASGPTPTGMPEAETLPSPDLSTLEPEAAAAGGKPEPF
jgi:hypothetical protein